MSVAREHLDLRSNLVRKDCLRAVMWRVNEQNTQPPPPASAFTCTSELSPPLIQVYSETQTGTHMCTHTKNRNMKSKIQNKFNLLLMKQLKLNK